jgi:4-carboxymuconolactone decarboxylase
VTRPVAAVGPGFGTVVHRGRPAGKPDRTLVKLSCTQRGVIVALPCGARTDRVRKVLAAGRCEIERLGRRERLRNPRLRRDPSLKLAHPVARPLLRLAGVADFLALEDAHVDKEQHMARIAGVSARDAGLRVRLTYYFTRRQLKRLTGRAPGRMLEPLEVYAHVPGLLQGVGSLEQATARLHRLEERLKDLAELKAATLTQCEYCIDLGLQVARRAGLSDAHLLALPSYRTSALFTDVEKLVLDYAVGMSRTPVEVSDALFAELRRHFDDAQLVELTHVIALENMRGRFNLALGIGAAGFSAGMVCAVPATPPAAPASAAP